MAYSQGDRNLRPERNANLVILQELEMTFSSGQTKSLSSWPFAPSRCKLLAFVSLQFDPLSTQSFDAKFGRDCKQLANFGLPKQPECESYR